MKLFYTTLPWLYSRQTFLIAGTLLLSVSPFLCATFYFGAALISALNGKQVILNRERLAIASLIAVISVWMILRKVRPESLLPGTISLSDYVPFFIFFFLLSLTRFSEVEIESFCYALIATIPQQFFLAIGEKYFHWYGKFYFPAGSFPLIDVYIGPVEPGLQTSASFFNPNILACYGVLCAGVALSLLVTEIDSFRIISKATLSLGLRIISIGCCLALCIILLTWTGSRNGWIAFILAVSMFAWLKRKAWYVKFGGIALPLLTIIASINIGWLTQVARSFIPEIISSRLPSIYSVFSYEDRGVFYTCAFKLIQEKPIIGWGIGQFASECSRRTKEAMSHTHNIFLQLASEIGLPFTLLIVFLIGYIIVAESQFLQKIKDSKSRINSLCVGLFIVSMSTFLMQFFDLALLMSYRLNFVFWICLAIPYSLTSKPKLS